ncbi:hypothetical protein CspHIS471_0401290 [Cutaneotrichosporon sp. HIS471]|nr:hypothetical protein CspHIS471_0401290 [Cutaneotrichosporon sp. HIS471]
MAKPKPKPKLPTKPRSSMNKPPPPVKGPKTRTISKSLVLQMLLVKLADSKTCDWHALSLRLAPPKSKRGKVKAGISGSDLHELYHNFILPGLKAGRPLWREGEGRDVEVEEGEEGEGEFDEEEGAPTSPVACRRGAAGLTTVEGGGEREEEEDEDEEGDDAADTDDEEAEMKAASTPTKLNSNTVTNNSSDPKAVDTAEEPQEDSDVELETSSWNESERRSPEAETEPEEGADSEHEAEPVPWSSSFARAPSLTLPNARPQPTGKADELVATEKMESSSSPIPTSPRLNLEDNDNEFMNEDGDKTKASDDESECEPETRTMRSPHSSSTRDTPSARFVKSPPKRANRQPPSKPQGSDDEETDTRETPRTGRRPTRKYTRTRFPTDIDAQSQAESCKIPLPPTLKNARKQPSASSPVGPRRSATTSDPNHEDDPFDDTGSAQYVSEREPTRKRAKVEPFDFDDEPSSSATSPETTSTPKAPKVPLKSAVKPTPKTAPPAKTARVPKSTPRTPTPVAKPLAKPAPKPRRKMQTKNESAAEAPVPKRLYWAQ